MMPTERISGRDEPLNPFSAFNRFIDIVDDSGYLLLCDPATLNVFIREGWRPEELHLRMLREMTAGRLIVWKSAGPWTYKVRLSAERPSRAVRQVAGRFKLQVNEQLGVGTYAELTASAAMQAVPPQMAQLPLSPGNYEATLFRLFSSGERYDAEGNFNFHTYPRTLAHYHVQLTPAATGPVGNFIQAIPNLGGLR